MVILNTTNTRAEDLKQKIINDYNGLNIPIVAEKILDLILVTVGKQAT